ncbi:MAG: leucine-rich repeat domain-containing protein [Saprospiraceae bacterium]|nr:leucine-rich repeat domain-containing protein [Saprospiraceae bacterium]MCB9326847.1 leucine-rich repeat domain-containing protein [Lewinellaceae bacterium]
MDSNEYYLFNASAAQLENLRTFLHSDQKTNQLLAIGMMQTGGLPNALVADVLQLYLDKRTGYTKRYSETKVLIGVKSEIESLLIKFGYDEFIFPDPLHPVFKDGETAFQKMKATGVDPNKFVACFPAEFVFKGHRFEDWAVAQKVEQEVLNFDTELNLKGMGLEKIPEVVGAFNQLKRLNVFNNKIKQLPASFASLDQLEELVLGKNNINSYSPALFSLKSLMFLDLSENELPDFSPKFARLEKMEWLFLAKNFIRELSPEIVKMKSLKHFSVAFNSIAEIPSFIGEMGDLEVLNLEGNQINTVPEELGQLTKLRSLNLHDNPLAKNISEKIRLKKLLPRYCELII